MGLQHLIFLVTTLGVVVSPTIAAPGCSNTLFMIDGYKHGMSGANFRDQPTVPGWNNVLFKYENGIIPIIDKLNLDQTLAAAVPALEKMVVEQYRRCPGNKVALHGFSFGALVAGNVIESLAAKQDIPHKQINAVLYGDPRRPSQSKGTEGSAGGCLTVLPSLPGQTAPGPRNTGDIDVSYICNQNDVICNMANPFTNAAAVANEVQGYLSGDHGYQMNPFGEHSNPGDYYISQPPRLQYGAPLPLPVATPNQLLNGNQLYKNLVAKGEGIADILNRFGLPGGDLFKPLDQFLKDNGIAV